MGDAADFRITTGIKVRYVVPKAMPLTYADQMSVVATDNDVVVSLFQTDGPVSGNFKKPRPGEPLIVDANCVVRVVLTHRKAKELHQVLGDLLREHAEVQAAEARAEKPNK